MVEIEVQKYKSVGGWLSLLCFGLIILSPGSNISLIYKDFNESFKYFNYIDGLENYIYLKSITIIILMVLSIWSGISLLLIKPYAVKLAKIYFILFLINGIIQLFYPAIVGLNQEFIENMKDDLLKNTMTPILSFIIWYTYLSVSKRVKNTYPISEPIAKNVNQKETDFKKIGEKSNEKYQNLLDKNRTHKTEIKKSQMVKLKSAEIIIGSIVIATIIAINLGYYYGETQYFLSRSGRRVNHSSYHTYTEFNYNYLISIAGFIISGGILYLVLNRIKFKKNE